MGVDQPNAVLDQHKSGLMVPSPRILLVDDPWVRSTLTPVIMLIPLGQTQYPSPSKWSLTWSLPLCFWAGLVGLSVWVRRRGFFWPYSGGLNLQWGFDPAVLLCTLGFTIGPGLDLDGWTLCQFVRPSQPYILQNTIGPKPDIKHQLRNTSYETPITKHQLPNTSYQTPVTKHQFELPNTRYQIVRENKQYIGTICEQICNQ